MIVLGFQEIVPLTAQQMVQTDPEKKCVFLLAWGLLQRSDFLSLQAYVGDEDFGHP
jgi:hypothetical protein